MKTSRAQFVTFLKTQQWSLAATVSVRAMIAGDQEEIEWYCHTLMKTCNRWRVLRMIKTWLANDVLLDMNHSYGDQYYQQYGQLVHSLFGGDGATQRQQQRREEFRKTYLQSYQVLDPLVLWLSREKLVDNR